MTLELFDMLFNIFTTIATIIAILFICLILYVVTIIIDKVRIYKKINTSKDDIKKIKENK